MRDYSCQLSPIPWVLPRRGSPGMTGRGWNWPWGESHTCGRRRVGRRAPQQPGRAQGWAQADGRRPGAPLWQTGAGPERDGAADAEGLVCSLPESRGHLCSSSLSWPPPRAPTTLVVSKHLLWTGAWLAELFPPLIVGIRRRYSTKHVAETRRMKAEFLNQENSETKRKNSGTFLLHFYPSTNGQEGYAFLVVSNSLSLWPQELQPTRLLWPCKFPGKNTGVGCHFLHQGVFPTQGSNSHLTSPALAGGFFTNSATWEAWSSSK